MEKKVGIIGAMEIEVELLKSLLKPVAGKNSVDAVEFNRLKFYEGTLDGVNVVIVKSGVGKVNAALCAQTLVMKFNVTHIINSGIAGAMGTGLGVLDFVVSEGAVYHDMDAVPFGYKITEIPQMEVSDFKADAKMIEAAKNAFSSLEEMKGHKLVEGRIATGDQFIAEKSLKEKIRTNCSPACVEMEGAGIAHACYLNSTPFAIIRCMSDMADDCGSSTYEFNETNAANLSAALVRGMITRF